MTTLTTLVLDTTPEHLDALAQLVKRLTLSDARSKTSNDDDAYTTMEAVRHLAHALEDLGYSPR